MDSLRWFLQHCFPLIAAKCPDIRLYVVGENAVPSLTNLARKVAGNNVVFTGRMESITSLYNSCRLFIAPTRFAAGIPHKVHEAASRGLPSVTTSLLATQLGWQHERELLHADTPADFAEQCVRLYADETLWKQLRQAGLAAVARDCSPLRFQSGLMQLFELPDSQPE